MRKSILFTGIAAIVVLQVLPAIAGSQWELECAVYRGNKLIEKNLCHRVVIQEGGGEEEGTIPAINLYKWKSGGTTRTENIEEGFTINGKPGKTIMAKPGFDLCIKNLSSGNTFCTRF